jgi:glucans biosynthesis protein C
MENVTITNTDVTNTSERVYSLDALRGIMMLLGLVIHCGVTYGSFDYGTAWPLKDPKNNSLVFDIIAAFIHSFRMPVFFVTAGYFAALLFYKKGPQAMIINRIKRILLPFAASVLIVWPLVFMAFAFSQAAFAGAPDPFHIAWSGFLSGNFIPFNVAHLWFLYFLIIYAVAGWAIASVFNKATGFTSTVNKWFHFIINNFWLRILCMSCLFLGCLYWMGSPGLKTNNAWSLDPATLTVYFGFFGTGWLLYRANSLQQLGVYPLWQLGITTLLFLVSILTPWPKDGSALLIQQILVAVSGSLFIFGFLALFLTYFSTYSPRLSYLMDAAYWVYIIHLPIAAFTPGLLAGVALPAFFKFAIVISITAVIAFTSYHYLVRGTFIGMFLNGKIHKRVKAIKETEMMVTN